MIKLKIGKSKKGTLYRCLVFIKENNTSIVLTFDTMTILRVTDMPLNALYDLEEGLYEV